MLRSHEPQWRSWRNTGQDRLVFVFAFIGAIAFLTSYCFLRAFRILREIAVGRGLQAGPNHATTSATSTAAAVAVHPAADDDTDYATAAKRESSTEEAAAPWELPTFVYSSMSREQEKLVTISCAVCLAEFKDGEKCRLLPRCQHNFHIHCIDVWLKSHPTCPLCRASAVDQPEAAASLV